MTEEKAPDVKSTRFRMIDYALIAMMILPILVCIGLKVYFNSLLTMQDPSIAEGVHISGALVFAEFEAPVMKAYISESQVNSWAVMISIFGLCLYLTHGLTTKAVCRRQL
ncbi:MAG: hypothetical protein IKF55_00435, partial [Oscillospiraceae bacterium]|nr:hypothetical protein [Oscillospiraceae bacterium]